MEGDASIEPLFFTSHIDTVSPRKGIRPVEKNERVESDGTTILGVNDKAGIAIVIELIHRLKENNIQHGPLEFILTPGEEVGLLGVKAVDMDQLEAKWREAT